jgi:hypothetical protein
MILISLAAHVVRDQDIGSRGQPQCEFHVFQIRRATGARRTGRGDLEQSRLASSGPKTQIFRICRALCLLPSQIQPRFNSNRKPRRLLQIYAKLCRSRRSTRAAHLRPIQRGMLQFVGFEVLAPQIIYGPVRMDDSQRKELLAAYTERLRNIANETPFDVGIY